MKYYYLDDQKQVNGPYDYNELLKFHESGIVADTTMVAAAGDLKWIAFSELKIPECSTWNIGEISCPHCHKVINQDFVPEKCPQCDEWIHGASRGLWWTFIYALRNFTNFKGRATRKEFWGFYLWFYLIHCAIEQTSLFFISAQNDKLENDLAQLPDESSFLSFCAILKDYYSDPVVHMVSAAGFIYWLAMILPLLSVTVRRLHDTGTRGTVIVVTFSLNITMLISFAWAFIHFFLDLPDIITVETFTSHSIVPLAMGFLSGVGCILCGIYLIFKMLQPSSRGANQYGPSTLYPKG